MDSKSQNAMQLKDADVPGYSEDLAWLVSVYEMTSVMALPAALA